MEMEIKKRSYRSSSGSINIHKKPMLMHIHRLHVFSKITIHAYAFTRRLFVYAGINREEADIYSLGGIDTVSMARKTE